ncbi:MAG: DUF456 family protein [Armatimonadota bacterium]|jgi:uncharacterized protein YqgC (DUF456 family)
MLSRLTGARAALLAAITLSCALLLSAVFIAGCGSEQADEPTVEVNVDEVPIVREGEEVEEPQEADEESAPAADEGDEAVEDAEAVSEDPALADLPEDEDGAEDESAGFWTRTGRALKAIAGFLGKLIFVLILPAAIAGTLVGMPGSALVLADAAIFSAFHGWAAPPWWVLLILLTIAVLAETVEHILSFSGVKKVGASNTTGVWTMVGGFVGAITGGIIAPLLATIGALAGPVGWIILAIVPPIGLGMFGGYLGGYYYELKQGRDPEDAKKAGWAALLGRLAGSFAKAMLVAVMAAIVLISTWGALF